MNRQRWRLQDSVHPHHVPGHRWQTATSRCPSPHAARRRAVRLRAQHHPAALLDGLAASQLQRSDESIDLAGPCGLDCIEAGQKFTRRDVMIDVTVRLISNSGRVSPLRYAEAGRVSMAGTRLSSCHPPSVENIVACCAAACSDSVRIVGDGQPAMSGRPDSGVGMAGQGCQCLRRRLSAL